MRRDTQSFIHFYRERSLCLYVVDVSSFENSLMIIIASPTPSLHKALLRSRASIFSLARLPNVSRPPFLSLARLYWIYPNLTMIAAN